MLYFENSKNRNVLALLFTCFALLECIFFGYALSELYSFLYPAMIDLIAVFIISCFIYFLDFKRKMNAVFIYSGILIETLFVSLSILYFTYGTEEGFYKIPSADFVRIFLPVLLTHCICVTVCGFLDYKGICGKYICLIPSILYGVYSYFISKTGILYSLCILLINSFSFLYLEHLKGQNTKLKKDNNLLLVASYIICVFLFFAYKEGLLLTQEASSFPNLMLMLTGVLFAVFGKRFGLYLVEFLSFYMASAYVLYRAQFNSLQSVQSLFGVIPLAVIGSAALYVNIDLEKKKEE